MANEEGVCAFCHRDDVSADLVGDTLHADGLTVHHHCLYFSSGLAQRGQEDEGIQGFLAPDILKEIKRGERCKLKCFVCDQRGAYVGCANKRCKMVGHFPCLQQHGFLFQFWGNFSAYCQKHCPTQPPLEILSPRRLLCPICVCQVPSAPSFDVLYSPCCKAVLHRECIQKYALSAGGYFFRCPLCNNTEAFVHEMLRLGIRIPERDATWESSGQFNDLYEVTKQCSAEECVCPKGRSFASKHGKFRFLQCKSCGRYIAHLSCSDDRLVTSRECKDCVLASAHNTPQNTPTSCPARREGGDRGAGKPSATPNATTPTTATPTTVHIATPTVVSNVGQLLVCSCAVCEARRDTGQAGGGATYHNKDAVHCPGELTSGVVTLAHLREPCTTASASQDIPEVPQSRRKRCLEYPSEGLRPKVDKASSPPPTSCDPKHAQLKCPVLPISKVSGSIPLPPLHATRPTVPAAASPPDVSVPLPPSLPPALPADLPLPPSPTQPGVPEAPLSRTLTYHQVMKAKATSCCKHRGNRL